jgi:DNA-binding transcriptional ArsR family regulator
MMNVDPTLTALLGGETRLRILAVLANAGRPLTAYRVAQVGEVRAAKVYPELRRLRGTGLVAVNPSGWVLRDEDVGRLLRKRIPLVWDVDWFEGKSARGRLDRQEELRLRKLLPPDWSGLRGIRYDV